MGRGFYPSSTGDSPPAPSSDARGPSVTPAHSVSVCKVSASGSRLPTPVIPASRTGSPLPSPPSAHPVTVLPPAEPPPVVPVMAPPPAEPPPPTLLPLFDLSLSCSPIHQQGAGLTSIPLRSVPSQLGNDGIVPPPRLSTGSSSVWWCSSCLF